MAKRPRQRMHTVSTFKDALDVLGGPAVVAEWLGTTTDNVLMMRRRGHVARGFHLHFYLTLRERGFQPAPSLFDLPNFDRLIMPKLHKRVSRARVKAVA